MKKALAYLAAGIVLFIILSALVSNIGGTHDDYYENLAKQQQLDYTASMTPVYRTAETILVIGFPVMLLAAGGLALYRGFRRATLIAPDVAGRLPVSLSDAQYTNAAIGTLEAYHLTQRTGAAISPVPHTYSPSIHYAPSEHYAPRLDYRTPVPQQLAEFAAPSLEDALANTPSLPGLTDLADIAHTPTMQSILLGLGPGGDKITVPMRSLWHIGLAGPTGAGKSNIARLIVPQLMTLQAKVVIADPKWTPFDAESGEDWQPIAQRLYLPPARKATEIADLLGWATDELEQRLELRTNGQKVGAPIFFYLDELTTITADVKGASDDLARLARIGRGVGFFLLMAAHNFLVKNGTGDTRDQVRTCFYLGGDLKTGSVLLDMPQRDLGQREGELSPGVALLRSSATTAAQLVRVPYASNRAVVGLLGDGSENMLDTSTQPPEVRAEGDTLPHSNALSPKALRVREMLKKQASQTDILAEIWGVKGGRGFPQAQQELREIMAQLVA